LGIVFSCLDIASPSSFIARSRIIIEGTIPVLRRPRLRGPTSK
jgi:hypothetical protein